MERLTTFASQRPGVVLLLGATYYMTVFDPRRDMILEEEYEYAICSEFDEDQVAVRLQNYLKQCKRHLSSSLSSCLSVCLSLLMSAILSLVLSDCLSLSLSLSLSGPSVGRSVGRSVRRSVRNLFFFKCQKWTIFFRKIIGAVQI